jgi:hypothetical protein
MLSSQNHERKKIAAKSSFLMALPQDPGAAATFWHQHVGSPLVHGELLLPTRSCTAATPHLHPGEARRTGLYLQLLDEADELVGLERGRAAGTAPPWTPTRRLERHQQNRKTFGGRRLWPPGAARTRWKTWKSHRG